MAIKKKSYNMYEAKTQLSKLVEKANQGVDVILMNRGEPVAKIIAFKAQPKRQLGFAKSVRMLRDFDEIPEGFEEYS
jgi:prevent-host-death family protein